jgi:hypothetical protein
MLYGIFSYTTHGYLGLRIFFGKNVDSFVIFIKLFGIINSMQ